jgi:ribosome-associated toxin RatA of RatAB toxin-antitoxin module
VKMFFYCVLGQLSEGGDGVMPVIKKQMQMPYTAAQMYALVDDIPSYPQFLPWCKEATEQSRSDDEVRATLTLAQGGLQRSFSTINRLRPQQMIELRLADGPFRQLEGFWRFQDVEGEAPSSMVRLDLEYEFDSRLLQFTFGPIFNRVASSLVQHFCERADELYTPSNPDKSA